MPVQGVIGPFRLPIEACLTVTVLQLPGNVKSISERNQFLDKTMPALGQEDKGGFLLVEY